MNVQQLHNFGVVDAKGDAFEFLITSQDDDTCRLVAVVQTERGPRRTEVAAVRTDLWRAVAVAAVRELVSEMREDERDKRAPSLVQGLNRLSPLVGRELGVLLIALMEEGAAERGDALLHAWRELAREERWWLYAKAAAPGQRPGAGWRRALFHALSETSDTRSAPADEIQKKNFGSTARRSSRKPASRATLPSPKGPTSRPGPPRSSQRGLKAAKAVAKARLLRRPKTTAR
jgi:hypothetical protein